MSPQESTCVHTTEQVCSTGRLMCKVTWSRGITWRMGSAPPTLKKWELSGEGRIWIAWGKAVWSSGGEGPARVCCSVFVNTWDGGLTCTTCMPAPPCSLTFLHHRLPVYQSPMQPLFCQWFIYGLGQIIFPPKIDFSSGTLGGFIPLLAEDFITNYPCLSAGCTSHDSQVNAWIRR